MDLNFQDTCCDSGMYLKFTRWKNARNSTMKYKTKFYRYILLDEIIEKHRLILSLTKVFATSMDPLSSPTTFFKRSVLKISINLSVLKEERTTARRHSQFIERKQ